MTTPPFLTPLVDLVLDEVEATKDAAILEIQTEGAEQVALASDEADRAEAAADSVTLTRSESYIQATTPITDEPALWFDTSNPSFVTISIQRG